MANNKQRDCLTNEYLTKYFPDNFSLALSSIGAARALIESGKEFRLMQLLDSVAKGKAREEKSHHAHEEMVHHKLEENQQDE